MFTDPLFANSSNNDFHLTSSSPAINAGDPNYSPVASVFDFDGGVRLYDGRVDIGVDEYGSTLKTNNFDKNEISLYPNPTTGIINMKDISDYSYKIYTINGQLIESRKYDSNIIDISNQKAGIYFIKLTNNNTLQEYYTKIIKQ